MDRKNWIALSALLPLVLALSAHAAITVTITNEGDPEYSSGNFATGYTGYLITLQSDVAKISGFDFGTTANRGIVGTMLQGLVSSGSNGVYDTPVLTTTQFNQAANALNLDTHVLIADTNINYTVTSESYGTAPTVPVSGTRTAPTLPKNTDPAGVEITGKDGALTLAGTLAANARAANVNFLYIVIPDAATLIGKGTVTTTNSNNVSNTFNVTFSLPTPEPTTATGLVIGTMSALARRRRAAFA